MRVMGWVWVALALAASVPLAASGAAAQGGEGAEQQDDGAEQDDGGSEEARRIAREAYARAEKLYSEGKFEKAEEAFQEAYDAVPEEPVVLQGIAKARESQGNISGAIRALERYLEERPDAPDKAKIEKRIEELRSRKATVSVDSKPSGARILLDGDSTGETTPAELEVTPGEHTVAVALQGHATASKSLELAPGDEQEMSVQLETKATPMGEDEVFGEGKGIEEPSGEDEAEEDDGEAGPSTGVWVSTGVAAAGLVSGTVLGFMALSEQSDFDEMPTESKADTGERLALFADVSFGIAAAAAITGVVLYFTGDESEEQGPADEAEGASAGLRIAPAVGRDGGGVTARVTF